MLLLMYMYVSVLKTEWICTRVDLSKRLPWRWDDVPSRCMHATAPPPPQETSTSRQSSASNYPERIPCCFVLRPEQPAGKLGLPLSTDNSGRVTGPDRIDITRTSFKFENVSIYDGVFTRQSSNTPGATRKRPLRPSPAPSTLHF